MYMLMVQYHFAFRQSFFECTILVQFTIYNKLLKNVLFTLKRVFKTKTKNTQRFKNNKILVGRTQNGLESTRKTKSQK